MCDMRVAADTARFAHPEITFGDVVYGPLHDLVGGAVARELCFTGRQVDAAEALRLGLVSCVVPAGQALDAARGLAAHVLRAPRGALLPTKAKAVHRAGGAGPNLDLLVQPVLVARLSAAAFCSAVLDLVDFRSGVCQH